MDRPRVARERDAVRRDAGSGQGEVDEELGVGGGCSVWTGEVLMRPGVRRVVQEVQGERAKGELTPGGREEIGLVLLRRAGSDLVEPGDPGPRACAESAGAHNSIVQTLRRRSASRSCRRLIVAPSSGEGSCARSRSSAVHGQLQSSAAVFHGLVRDAAAPSYRAARDLGPSAGSVLTFALRGDPLLLVVLADPSLI